MKKKIIIIIIVFLLIGLGVTSYIFSTLRIKDSDINITGNDKYTKEEMIDFIFHDDWDRNPVLMWYNSKYKEHVKIPFIEEYEIDIKSLSSVDITVYEKSVIGYVEYAGYNMYFDKDGIVVESSEEVLPGIPRITGLVFENILLYERLPIDNPEIFELVLNLTQNLQKYSLTVDKIYINEARDVVLYQNEIKIELGKGDAIVEKLQALSDMQPNLEGMSGTLNMVEYDENGKGYTFKKKNSQ